MAISARSDYFAIWQDFLDRKYNLCISNDILEEYVEVIGRNINPSFAETICYVILNSPNIVFVDPTYSFELIQNDIDDNKFVDCAIVSNAQFIVSNDRHFNALKYIPFPKVEVINIDQYLKQRQAKE